jgi:nickel/cobalt exporter
MMAALFVWVALALALLAPTSAGAHPADRLLQHSIITVSGDGVTVDIAISGGLIAVEGVARRIDANSDGVFAPDEAQAWLAGFLGQIQVTQDGRQVTPEPGGVSLALPDPTRFQLGLAPLTIRFALPVAPDATTLTRADILVTNTYLLDMTDFRVDIFVGRGGTMHGAVTPGKTMRLLVEIDPTQRGGGAPIAAAARWSATGVVARADDLLNRERTSQLVVAMLTVFVVMGALHAVQPGHGKTLVAAWLIATGGTPRDAVTLAGIVTLTHTLSVFVLGGATLAASQWFLPSRVIPALGVVSGLLVAGMGAQMLWRSTTRWRATNNAKHLNRTCLPNTAASDDGTDPIAKRAHGNQGERLPDLIDTQTGDPHAPGAGNDRYGAVNPHTNPTHDHHTLAHRHGDSHHHGGHAHEHTHGDPHHHHEHDHALLDDEAHARAHLADLDSVYVLANGRRRVALRQLVTLGVSGGIAPCPDALAILLLAIGIGQAAFGMIAILAFSLGLSVVLVAFGLGVALAGPAWRRARATAGEGRGARMDRLTAPLGRLAAISPVLSALVVLGLGIGLLWKALAI